MSSKETKAPKSNSPTTGKISQITFEDSRDRNVEDTESRTSRESKGSKASKSSKSKSKGGGGNISTTSSKASTKASKSSVESADFENVSTRQKPNEKQLISESQPQRAQQQSPSGSSTPKRTKEEREPANELEVSTIKGPSGPFTPIVYTFRVPVPQPSKGVRRGTAKCPPYHLQLDHTLAVIWTLFSTEEAKKPLGIAQLQWALEFLKGILNRRGEHPKDISLCIDAIQEELLEQYSDLVDDIKTIKVPCYSDLETSKPESVQNCSKSEESNFMCDSDTCIQRFGIDEEKSEDLITKTIPFSINYADMIKKSPPPVEQLYKCKQGSVSSTVPQQVKISGTGFQLEQNISRDNMIDFLKNWRREQVDKIQAELKRLRSIEKFINNVDNENFTPYVNETQLDNLTSSSKTSKSPRFEKNTKSGDVECGEKKKSRKTN